MPESQCSSYLNDEGALDAPLFEQSVDCIKIVGLDGTLVALNPGAVQALEIDDLSVLVGQHWAALWPEEGRVLVRAAMAAAFAGERKRFSAFCPTAIGTPRWWDVVVSPVRDADGNISRIMAVSRDISELHLAKEALREADRRKDEFLAVLAHELRNPLSACGMAANLLATRTPEKERVADMGRLLTRQVGHMSRLVEDLIDISRVSRGLLKLRNEAVRMDDIVNDALEQVHSTIRAKEHLLQVAFDDSDLTVFGDRTRLIQVVGNLLGNAARYTPSGGRISVGVARSGETVVVTIADTGVGINAAKIPGLFDLYTQIDHSTERSSSGLGLGLSLVRSLTELHHGSVTVRSDGDGCGSTFTVTLPAHMA